MISEYQKYIWWQDLPVFVFIYSLLYLNLPLFLFEHLLEFWHELPLPTALERELDEIRTIRSCSTFKKEENALKSGNNKISLFFTLILRLTEV